MSKIKKTVLILLILFFRINIAQPSNAEVIKYDTYYEVSPNNLTEEIFITIQINNRLGDEYADISIPFSKNLKISDLKAWISTPDGTVLRELKRSEIIEKSAISEISLYQDQYVKTFQLKHNVYPYLISYSYKFLLNQFIEITNWTPVLFKEISTTNAKLKITVPNNYPIKQHLSNIAEPTTIKNEDKTIYEWNSSYISNNNAEIYSNPELQLPSVNLMPINFKYGFEGTAESWESFGDWLFNLNQDLDILPESEITTINRLISSSNDKKETIKRLYHYLQDHTRYINVSIGIGGMKPYPASYVSTNKYGDCKALTNYMKTLLKYAGIESFYTIIYANEQPKTLKKDFPSQQFNHVILAVPLDNDTIWLENTSPINPFGYIGSFTQNRDALLIAKNNSKLVNTPSLKASQNQKCTKIEFDLSSTGDALATITNCYRGRDFEWFSQLNTVLNGDEKDRIIREQMPFTNYEVINWDLIKANRDSAKINLNTTLKLFKVAKSMGDESYINLYPTALPPFQKPQNRKYPLFIPYPISSSDTLIYNLPQGFDFKNEITPVSVDTKYGYFELKTKKENNKLYVIKTLLIDTGDYSLTEYPEFYKFIQTIKDTDKKNPIIIKPTSIQ